MVDFLRSTVEWKNWGMNLLTASALGTLVLTAIQSWSFAKQARAIWTNKNGDSVSVTMFGYLQFYLVSFVFYGIAMKSIAMMANGLLFICIIPIMFGLCKYKKITLGNGIIWRYSVCCPWSWLLRRISSNCFLACWRGFLSRSPVRHTRYGETGMRAFLRFGSLWRP